MVIHQMLGTRISDTLTLQTDCLYRQDGHPMIQIRQMKTTTFVKPISAELELLIEKGAEGGQFISREEFVKRTRANSAVMEKLDALGCLNDLPDSDQVSMF